MTERKDFMLIQGNMALTSLCFWLRYSTGSSVWMWRIFLLILSFLFFSTMLWGVFFFSFSLPGLQEKQSNYEICKHANKARYFSFCFSDISGHYPILMVKKQHPRLAMLQRFPVKWGLPIHVSINSTAPCGKNGNCDSVGRVLCDVVWTVIMFINHFR